MERGDASVVQPNIFHVDHRSGYCGVSAFIGGLCRICFTSLLRYLILRLGLAGPLLQVSKTVAGEVSFQERRSPLGRATDSIYQIQQQATTRLREHFSQPVPEALALSSTSVSTSSSSQRSQSPERSPSAPRLGSSFTKTNITARTSSYSSTYHDAGEEEIELRPVGAF